MTRVRRRVSIQMRCRPLEPGIPRPGFPLKGGPLGPGFPVPFVGIRRMLRQERPVAHQVDRRSMTGGNKPAIAREAPTETIIEVPSEVTIARQNDVGL